MMLFEAVLFVPSAPAQAVYIEFWAKSHDHAIARLCEEIQPLQVILTVRLHSRHVGLVSPGAEARVTGEMPGSRVAGAWAGPLQGIE